MIIPNTTRTQNSEIRNLFDIIHVFKCTAYCYRIILYKSMSYSCITSWRLNNSYSTADEQSPCD